MISKRWFWFWSVLILGSFLGSSCGESSAEKQEAIETHYMRFESPTALQDYLRWSPEKSPLISAHRGGPLPGFPENAIETFENILSYTPCLIECDVRESRDGVLLLMHDETLDRTTNGKGPVHKRDWADLEKLTLVDNDGKSTAFRVPPLAAALDWARGKAILQLDVKRGVYAEKVVQAIEEKNAAAFVMVITYNIEAAKRYHALNPDLMISAPGQGPEAVQKLFNSGIPAKNLIAFTGVREPSAAVYEALHEKSIRAILGVLGNLDRRAARRGYKVYVDLLKNGADVLATDNVPLALKGVNAFLESR